MELNSPSPIQEIKGPVVQKMGVELFIKREDLIHPVVSGNKWRKLKYNLEQAKLGNFETLLTFGGAYSNHIVATAFAAREEGLKSIGIIRGEEPYGGNHTLDEARSLGMKLHFVTRQDYRQKDSHMLEKLRKQFGNFFMIPEGGANEAGIQGVEELGGELSEFDYIIVPVGTGATLAGIINSKSLNQQAVGMAVLKGEGYLEENVKAFLKREKDLNWQVIHDFRFGGYAKFTSELIEFINSFHKQNQIPLDPIYTGKMMFGAYDLMQKHFFPYGSRIVCIHTGGLQGIRGFNLKHGNLIKSG